ncbi:lactoylglutathione lyase [Bacillus atrophaeus]|nr:VOC family protein [Bacillus atrophaeus]KXZ15415.1 glyoxalase [Bacillus atrophaeus]MED4806544.1 VOC family protein [Bacillus atrophaeus]GED02620.1 lactoylglutathione lyase [Bacillus atrophaeus]
MNLSMRYVILYVSDGERSLHFYKDILGLTVRAQHDTYVEFDTGSQVLAFNTRKNVREITPLEIPEEAGYSQTFELGFVTEDVGAVIEKLRGEGVSILSEPKVKPWGQTVAYVADPDGHYIEICSPVE